MFVIDRKPHSGFFNAVKPWGEKLRDTYERFCLEFLIDLNATQAAIRAGYSEKTAYSQGQRLLKNVEVQDRIAELKKERSKRTKITQDRVLNEIAQIAFDDMGNYLSFKQHEESGQIVVDIKDSTTIDTRNVSEVSLGKDGQFKFKLNSKIDALNMLGKHLGLFNADMGAPKPNEERDNMKALTVEELKAIANNNK